MERGAPAARLRVIKAGKVIVDEAGAVHELKGRRVGQGRAGRLITAGLSYGQGQPGANPGAPGKNGVAIGRR